MAFPAAKALEARRREAQDPGARAAVLGHPSLGE